MGFLAPGGARPPPPPPPPANPPTYASSLNAPPSQSGSAYAGLGQSILTNPFGAEDQRATQRKTLLGQ
jgi:hypothetical protein